MTQGPTTTEGPDTRGRRTPSTRTGWRAVALPAEHGGWSLTAEPVLLGLLVAPSIGGAALGVAALLAFVARTPLRLVLVDLHRRRWLPRTRSAVTIAAVELAVLTGAVALAVVVSPSFWYPLAAAAPLLAVELRADMRSRSRHLLPELAGAIGIGSVAAAIALAGGASTGTAWGLWIVVAARATAAIPHVRVRLLRGRARAHPDWHNDLAQSVAVVAAVAARIAGLVPTAAVAALVVAALANTITVRRPTPAPRVIGFQQMGLGLFVLAVTAIAV